MATVPLTVFSDQVHEVDIDVNKTDIFNCGFSI